MDRIVTILGYAIFILAVLGEINFIGFVTDSSTDSSFAFWNAFTYAVLALIGIALILLGSKEARGQDRA